MAERWRMLAVLTLARTVMGFQFQSVAAMAPRLTGEGGLSHAQLGLLIGLYLLPGIALALPAGWLGQRFGNRRLVLIALTLMTAGGAVLGLSADFGMMLAGRLVAGAGAVLLNVLVTKMVADWFAGREVVPAMGLLITSWPLGIALAMVTLPFLPAGQPAGLGASLAALAALLALLLFALVYRPAPATGAPPQQGAGLTPGEVLRAVCAGAVWTFYNAGLITVIAFGAGFLAAAGQTVAAATAAVSLVGWLIIPSLAMGGWLSAHVARPTALVLACLAVAGAAIALLMQGAPALAALIVIGLVLGPPGPLIMSLPVEAVQAEMRSLGMGIYFTCYYIGMAAVPPFAGWLQDATGSPAAPLGVATACLVLAMGALLLFRALQARAVVA